jgi:hypothetical protein
LKLSSYFDGKAKTGLYNKTLCKALLASPTSRGMTSAQGPYGGSQFVYY